MNSWQKSFRRVLARYLVALLVTAAVTLGLWLLRDALTLANFSLLYLLAILVIAIWQGIGPSLLAGLVSFFSFNFFLIRPFYTLTVEDPRELLDLVIFLLVALITGQLASYARQQAERARQQATEQNILYSLSSAFNQLTEREDVYETLKEIVEANLPVGEVIILPGVNDELPAGDQNFSFTLLSAGETIYGTLRAGFDTAPTGSQLRLLAACAEQAAEALQRIDLSSRAQRSRTLEEADRLKTALLHAVSHDLRTPITIIKTSASNLLALRGRLSEAERLETVRTIEQEADQLNMLVGNLLDLSRLKAGVMVTRREWNSLAEIAGDVAARAWELNRSQRVRLLFPDDLPLVRCDYGLILQALSNIIDNVLRYEPSASQVEIRGSYSADEVQVTVVNHGPTISSEEKEHIMEPFYHGADGHIGLGLAISREIVELHHGHLWVEDTPGGGATFIMTLPREEMEARPDVAPHR